LIANKMILTKQIMRMKISIENSRKLNRINNNLKIIQKCKIKLRLIQQNGKILDLKKLIFL